MGDLAANVNLKLHESKAKVLSATKEYEGRDMYSIHSALHQIVNRVDSFMEKKRRSTLEETAIAEAIFAMIRHEEAENERVARQQARLRKAHAEQEARVAAQRARAAALEDPRAKREGEEAGGDKGQNAAEETKAPEEESTKN